MKLLRRLQYLLGRRRADADLTEELEHHRAMGAGDHAGGDWDRAYAESRAVWAWPRLKWPRRAVADAVRDFLRAGRRVSRWMGRELLDGLSVMVLVLLQVCWEPITGTPLTLRIRVTLCVFYVLVAIAEGVKQAERKLDGEGKASPKRVFVEDPEAVLELAKLTGIDSIRPFNRYLGKWMTLTGEFEGLAESLDHDTLHVSLSLEDGRRLNLRFGTGQREKLRPLQPGQRITAIGEIEHCYFELRPKNCELVRAEPLRVKPRLTLAS